MSYTVHLTDAARRDMLEISRYIAETLRSPLNAAGQLTRLEQAIASLRQMPERFRFYDHKDWPQRNLRMMPVDHYLVFYTPNRDEQTVTVLRVFYGGRDIDSQLDTLE